MAVLTRQELKDYNNANVNTNGAQAITGQILNTDIDNVIDSAVLNSEAESYQWFNDTDPESIGTPPASNYYQGVYNGKRWTKDSAGLIVYSASGLWTITDDPDTTIVLNEDMLGNLIRWNGTANGTLTLDNSVYNFDEGWHTAIYNNTPDLSITIEAGGTDVIRSHNNIYQVPAYSYVDLGIIYVNGAVEWAVAIEQTRDPGTGVVALGVPNLGTAVTADTWTLINNPSYSSGQLINFVVTANGGLQVNYPNNGTNGVYINITIMASMSIPTSTQTLDLSFGVNGTVFSEAELIRQSSQSGASQTADMYWPFTFNFSGVVANGSVINPFIRSDTTSTIDASSMVILITSEAYTGVDIG